MPNNKRIFSNIWLNDSRFSEWLKRTHSKWEAYCVYCQKNFDISNMGVASLLSHASAKKHWEIQLQWSRNTGTTFFGNSSTGEVQETSKKGNLARKENKVKKHWIVWHYQQVPSKQKFYGLWKLYQANVLSRIERTFWSHVLQQWNFQIV